MSQCDIFPDCDDLSDENQCDYQLESGMVISLASPNYPGYYPPNSNVNRTFQYAEGVDDTNIVYVIRFGNIALDWGDYLTVGSGSEILRRYGSPYFGLAPDLTIPAGDIYIAFSSDGSVGRNGFNLTLLVTYDDPEPVSGLLFVANPGFGNIQVAAFDDFDVFSLNFTSFAQSDGSYMYPLAVDFDPYIETVFWTDQYNGILRGSLDGSNQYTLYSNTYRPDGLALDLMHQTVYWTDADLDEINSISYNGTMKQIIINTDLDIPRAIVIQQELRVMFWTDWGSRPKIERANLDGSNRTIIVDCIGTCGWPNGISLNDDGTLLYWIDNFNDKVEVVDLWGANRRTILQLENVGPYDIAVFKSNILWTEFGSALSHAWTYANGSGVVMDTALDVFFSPRGIHVYIGNISGFSLSTPQLSTQPPPAESTTGLPNTTMDISINLDVGESHEIRSPGYPDFYPNNAMTTWYITTPSDYTLEITFLVFNLEPGFDGLSIGKGHTAGSMLWKRLTGLELFSPIRFSGSEFWMVFASDSTETYEGFLLELEVVSESTDCGSGSFRCNNKNCLLNDTVTCDGRDDCGDFSDEEYCPSCVPIPSSVCGQLPYNLTYFPNRLFETSEDAVAYYDFLFQVNSIGTCHPRMSDFACNILFPECTHHGPTIRPCYKDCVNVTLHCKDMYESSGEPWPVDCKDFSDADKIPTGYCRGTSTDLFQTDICGTRPGFRKEQEFAEIVGGVNAISGEIPWIVYLESDDDLFCGGTLITSKWVVTASHCVEDGKKVDAVVLGALNSESPSEYQQRIEPSGIFLHPDYSIGMQYNADIALIELSIPVNFTDFIRPACLADSSKESSLYSPCLIAGWGNDGDGYYPEHLQKAVVNLFEVDECRSFYGNDTINENMLCAGYERGEIDTCDGDSGGPLVCEGEDGRWHLVGVTSFGRGCARQGFPGVYARVSKLLPFILSTVESNTDTAPSSTDFYHEVSEGASIQIMSPNFPGIYPPNVQYRWFFTKDNEDLPFYITILELSLNSYDYLVATADNPETNTTTNIFYRGYYSYNYENTFLVNDSELIVLFSSDAYYGDTGFRLEISLLNTSGYFFCDGSAWHNPSVQCDLNIDCDDGTDENGCDIELAVGESVNITSDYHSKGGYVLWKFSTSNRAFLIEPSYPYLSYGSYLTFGYGHDPNINGTRTWTIDYYDYSYSIIFPESAQFHLMNNSQMFIEYVYSYYSYDDFRFQITSVDGGDFEYCDIEPSTEAVKTESLCNGIIECKNGNDEYMCDPFEVSQGDVLTLQSYRSIYYSGYQATSVTWSLIAPDDTYLVLHFTILAIAPNDTLCVGRGNDALNDSSIISCISVFNSLGYWYYWENETNDVYASIVTGPTSSSLWVGFNSTSDYERSAFQILASAASEVDDYKPCGDSTHLFYHVNQSCDGAAVCPEREDETGCPPRQINFTADSENSHVTVGIMSYSELRPNLHIIWTVHAESGVLVFILRDYYVSNYTGEDMLQIGEGLLSGGRVLFNATDGYNYYYENYRYVETTTNDGWIVFKTGTLIGSYFSLIIRNGNITDDFCDFELGSFCYWKPTNGSTGYYRGPWAVTSGNESYFQYQELDHTSNSTDGLYLLMSPSYHYYEDYTLEMEVLRSDPLADQCLSFWYIITGSLHLRISYKTNGSEADYFLLWMNQGPEEDDWAYAEVNLFGLPSGTAILEGFSDYYYYDGYEFIAIDDIGIMSCSTDSTLVIEPDSPPNSIVIHGNKVPYLDVRTYPGYHLKFDVTNSSQVLPRFTVTPGLVPYSNASYPSSFDQPNITFTINMSSFEIGTQFAVLHPSHGNFFGDHYSFAVVEISAVLTGDSLICSHFPLVAPSDELCDGKYFCASYDDETHSTCGKCHEIML
nr:uncharacterized protein LOC129270250 [Lytechinus pictus]